MKTMLDSNKSDFLIGYYTQTILRVLQIILFKYSAIDRKDNAVLYVKSTVPGSY